MCSESLKGRDLVGEVVGSSRGDRWFWFLEVYYKIIWKLLKGFIRGVVGWDLYFKKIFLTYCGG